LVATVANTEAPTDGLISEDGKQALEALRRTMSNDLMSQLATALRTDYSVRVNRNVVNTLY